MCKQNLFFSTFRISFAAVKMTNVALALNFRYEKLCDYVNDRVSICSTYNGT